MIGRGFFKNEDQDRQNAVAIVSHSFLVEKLGGRGDVLGLSSPLASMNYIAMARMRSGVTRAQVSAEMTGLGKSHRKTLPEPIEIDPVVDPQEPLKSSGRSASEGRHGHRAGRILVATEVALSTVLLFFADLLLRSFTATLRVNPCVSVERVLTARINLPPKK